MRASMSTYENVALNCNSYSPKQGADAVVNSTTDKSGVSCTTCKHFTNEKYCDIDLYDQIVKEHGFK